LGKYSHIALGRVVSPLIFSLRIPVDSPLFV